MCHNILTVGTEKAAFKHIEELSADIHITNHYCTLYFYERYKAKHPDKKILNMCINQDCKILPYNLYPSDLLLTPYSCNLIDYPPKYKWLNKDNFKLIPYPLREEFVKVDPTKINKKKSKEEIDLDSSKMTIAILEGGYGIGKGYKIFKKLIKSDLNLNIIYFCGKNEELLKQLKESKLPSNISLLPVGYTSEVIKYLLASDLVLVKAGPNVLAEVAALGLPAIAVHANFWHEKVNARYYESKIGNTCFIPNPRKAFNKIIEFYNDRKMLDKMSVNVINNHLEYNNEKIADTLFAKIKERYPDIDK